jgi:hypothetical protein
MNKTMAMRLAQAARNTAVGGFISWDPSEFGTRVLSYNGIPILQVEDDNTGTPILPFSEANPGGGAAASTSIYVVSFGDGSLVGIQNGTVSVRDLGELETKPVLRTRTEWYAGIAIFSGKAVARLRGIKDAAITA